MHGLAHDKSHITDSLGSSLEMLVKSTPVSQIQDKLVVVFDKNLKTVDCNPAILLLLEKPVPADMLVGKDISFFAPDLEDLGEMDKLLEIVRNGGAFSLDCYETVTREINRPIYVQTNIFRFGDLIYTVADDITEQVRNAPKLISQAERIRRLERYCADLKTALKILMNLSMDESNSQYDFYCNIEQMVFPMIDILRNTDLDKKQLSVLDVIANYLNSMMDPFARMINSQGDFTKRELQIAGLVRQGKTAKEIANILFLSKNTVDFHKANIRKKLGICNTGNDLQKYLLEKDTKHSDAQY